MEYEGRHYPDNPFERMMKVKVEDSSKGRFQFDETYPYLDDSFGYKLCRLGNSLLLQCLIIPYMKLTLGLKVEGRDILKKYKDELKGGAVTVCNHVFVADAVAVAYALRKFRSLHLPSFGKHFNNKGFYWFLHSLGGVPVPETMGGMRGFDDAFETFHKRGEWIHVFPEYVRWDYYPYVRPFRKGAFTMAYKYNCPLIPLVITFKKKPFFGFLAPKKWKGMTIHILEPVFPDRTATRKSEVIRLREEAQKRMVEGAGIQNNIWPAIPDDE